ncbi:hypothetical protein EG68_05188 [Paragonimus skrjabini miyazakii]|uniref:Uncharacterized protein n=1 Tax=Paragonimus skrjabini miyazakii TaxID=59628 RepID=A0A8S9Z3E7_9TREM|nr:hypothetical protein EG68_05188 [Paragonimus skrjabini miyazakii]
MSRLVLSVIRESGWVRDERMSYISAHKVLRIRNLQAQQISVLQVVTSIQLTCSGPSLSVKKLNSAEIGRLKQNYRTNSILKSTG